jgi:PPOX class probable F420-dependent enzyme
MPTTWTLYAWVIEATAGVDSAWVGFSEHGLAAEGHISARLPEPHSMDYRLEVDAEFVTRRIAVQVRRGEDTAEVEIRHHDGRWSVNGDSRPDLDGALDVDLAACPLTNVMPIRRHHFVRRPGTHELVMVFVDVPSLRVYPSRQRYTHVRVLPDGGAIVRYESGDFRSDLTVDADGFVVDYPGLGRRADAGLGDRMSRSGRDRPEPGAALRANDTTFMAERRTATLATLSPAGRPRLVPICFVLDTDTSVPAQTVIWSPLDAKPKRAGDPRHLARVRDIVARPDVTLLFDRWSEDWSELAWVRALGEAKLVEAGADDDGRRRAVEALRAKYPQYLAQPIDRLPMIRIALADVTSWQARPARSASAR